MRKQGSSKSGIRLRPTKTAKTNGTAKATKPKKTSKPAQTAKAAKSKRTKKGYSR